MSARGPQSHAFTFGDSFPCNPPWNVDSSSQVDIPPAPVATPIGGQNGFIGRNAWPSEDSTSSMAYQGKEVSINDLRSENQQLALENELLRTNFMLAKEVERLGKLFGPESSQAEGAFADAVTATRSQRGLSALMPSGTTEGIPACPPTPPPERTAAFESEEDTWYARNAPRPRHGTYDACREFESEEEGWYGGNVSRPRQGSYEAMLRSVSDRGPNWSPYPADSLSNGQDVYEGCRLPVASNNVSSNGYSLDQPHACCANPSPRPHTADAMFGRGGLADDTLPRYNNDNSGYPPSSPCLGSAMPFSAPANNAPAMAVPMHSYDGFRAPPTPAPPTPVMPSHTDCYAPGHQEALRYAGSPMYDAYGPRPLPFNNPNCGKQLSLGSCGGCIDGPHRGYNGQMHPAHQSLSPSPLPLQQASPPPPDRMYMADTPPMSGARGYGQCMPPQPQHHAYQTPPHQPQVALTGYSVDSTPPAGWATPYGPPMGPPPQAFAQSATLGLPPNSPWPGCCSYPPQSHAVPTMPTPPATRLDQSKPRLSQKKDKGQHAPCSDGPDAVDRSYDTTVMLRNIPNDYTRDMAVDLLNKQGFKGKYDFFYLPIDFISHCSVGYAFVNLCKPEFVRSFWRCFDGFKKWELPTKKVCKVCWAGPHQGVDQHIDRYRNSPVMHPSVSDEYRPILFENGERVPFPLPARPPKAPHIRKREDIGKPRTKAKGRQS